MGIFRKVGDWLNEKYDRFVRGEEEPVGGYYATEEAEQAYNGAPEGVQEGAPEAEAPHQTMDPFGRGEGDYGGRVPYRSRYDQEREPQQGAWQQQQPQPQQQGAWQNAQQPQQGAWQNAQQPQQGERQQGNVVPFPGMQMSQDGSVFAHVEYIVLLRSRSECKDVIAYIKSNASVFLNMEFIASDNERQRCVDMLSGAAYTLGCALNKISPRGIYLISSPSVRVVLDPAMQKFAAAPEAQGFVRQRYDGDGYQGGYAQQQQQPAQAEQQPGGGFSSGSPTMRFQAQGAQHMPASFGSVMTGSAPQGYQQSATGRYAAMQP